MAKILLSAFAFASLLAGAVLAGQPNPVELAAIDHAPASLDVVGPDGNVVSYSPADLERFATFSLVTTTPWRDEPAEFEGVMLVDILAASGLDDVPAIKVTAENDFAVTIPRELWDSVPVLVATRVDGQPHSRRARGPIQFVIDMETYRSSDVAKEAHLVWMAARIEPAE